LFVELHKEVCLYTVDIRHSRIYMVKNIGRGI